LKGIGVSNVRTVAVFAALALIATAILAGPPASGAAVTQPDCAKAKVKVRKAKGAKKRRARKALKQCQNNLTVYRQIVGSRITGVRADGVAMDDLYCPKGRWQSDVGQGGPRHKSGWVVRETRFRNAKNYQAIVAGRRAGGEHQIAIARKGNKWMVGWAYFGEARDLGNATLTKPAKECAGF